MCWRAIVWRVRGRWLARIGWREAWRGRIGWVWRLCRIDLGRWRRRRVNRWKGWDRHYSRRVSKRQLHPHGRLVWHILVNITRRGKHLFLLLGIVFKGRRSPCARECAIGDRNQDRRGYQILNSLFVPISLNRTTQHNTPPVNPVNIPCKQIDQT